MLLGLLSLFIGQIFGNTVVPIGTKISAPFTGPLLFVFLRFFVSSILLFFIFFTFGIAYTTVIMGTLIYSLTPILVGLGGHFFLDESLTRQKLIGLFIAFIGLLFLVSQSFSHYQQNAFGQPLGNMLICIAMLGYSYYIFHSRKVLHNKNHLPLQTTFWTFIFTTLFILVALLSGITMKAIMLKPLPSVGIIGFLVVGAGSLIQYLFLQIGVKKTNAFTASLFQYIAPFIAATATIPLLHERVTFHLIIGGLLILIGVFIATTYSELSNKVLWKRQT